MSNPEQPIRQLIKTEAALSFTIVADVFEHRVVYTIYDIDGWDGDKPLWHKSGDSCSPSPVYTLEEAEPYLHGYVKWDGCSDWSFDKQDRCMLHGCCREHIQRFGDVMGLCWDWAAELCPHWDEFCTGVVPGWKVRLKEELTSAEVAYRAYKDACVGESEPEVHADMKARIKALRDRLNTGYEL